MRSQWQNKQLRLKAPIKQTALCMMNKMLKRRKVWILSISLPSARHSQIIKVISHSIALSWWCSEVQWMVLGAGNIWLNTYQAWQAGPSCSPLKNSWTKHKPLSQLILMQGTMKLLKCPMLLRLATLFLNRPMKHRKRSKSGVNRGQAPKRCITWGYQEVKGSHQVPSSSSTDARFPRWKRGDPCHILARASTT